MTKPNVQLNDCIDELSQFNAAFYTVVQLLAGCDDVNAPPASYLWQLLAVLSRDAENVLLDLQKITAKNPGGNTGKITKPL